MNLSDVEMPTHFSGVVRLFPLQDLVLFPGVVQALHVFEPRYRKMTRDLLADDQLVSICTCLEDIDSPMEVMVPKICPAVCISKVVAHRKLADGRFNLMVVGLKRANIVRELTVDQPYRMAAVDLVDDVFPGREETLELRADLLETCDSIDLFRKSSQPADLQKMLSSDFHLGLLVDLICFTANLDCPARLEILQLQDIGDRCRRLIEFLIDGCDSGNEPRPAFPPDFSNN